MATPTNAPSPLVFFLITYHLAQQTRVLHTGWKGLLCVPTYFIL